MTDWPHDVGLAVTSCDPADTLERGTRHLHNAADLAAEVADIPGTPLDDAFDRLLCSLHVDSYTAGVMRRLFHETVYEATRRGYLLALTADASGRGWPAWETAAQEVRARAGCSGVAHYGGVIAEVDADIRRRRAGTGAGQDE